MILMGDSASSVDPLSEMVPFLDVIYKFSEENMSSIAPYVINTILNKIAKEKKL